jgi:CobQ-like glutamine amidotransferase family enzyme/UDP-N-acetylmuramyl tripeptide synthase
MSQPHRQLRLCSLYPDRLNIYGDRGNLMVLAQRCAWRGIDFTLDARDVGDAVDPDAHDLFYIGGGQDRDQRVAGLDFTDTKRDALRAAAARDAVVLGVCGGYQMLGTSYEVDGQRLPGAGLVDARTERPAGPRLIGPVSIEVQLDGMPTRTLAGFENHGGRTHLGPGESPLGRVLRGHGSNGQDGSEGVRRGNVIGSYLHGPLLAKNAWFADWLIAAALGLHIDELPPLEDTGEEAAHRSGVRAAAHAGPNDHKATAPHHNGLYEEVWLQARLGENLDSVYRFDAPPFAPRAFLPSPNGNSLTYTKLDVARAAGRVSRAGRHGAGTAAPGRLLLRLVPDAIGRMAERLPQGSVLVSGTNGKTTTSRMLTAMLRADGRAIVHNHAGANTHWGVATALVDQAGEQGVFELDEAWLPLVAAQLHPRLLVLCNLSRDRLDSYGEVERIHTLWRGLLTAHPGAQLVVNADDPRLVALARAGIGGDMRDGITHFGIDDPSVARAEPQHPRDGRTCPRCGAEQSYERSFVGHLGHYECRGCGARRPRPEVAATDVRLQGTAGSRISVSTPEGQLEFHVGLPGLHNVYNALAAIAAAVRLGVPPAALQEGLEDTEVPFGRAETINLEGKAVHVCLMKNPVGANAILETLEHEQTPPQGFDLWLALNDLEPDGRDVSWIWDVDFESFAPRVRRVTCTGRRAPELALRLKYAGWPIEAADVDEDLPRSFERALAKAPDRLVALPTYTALLQLEAALEDHGAASSEWAASAPRVVAM